MTWSGVRDARTSGPTAPQIEWAAVVREYLPNVITPGDDYLHVNVWTSDLEGAAPVVVFLHGGAFVNGSNAVSGYDGSSFARDGIVFVSVNYRLGADGFLWFGDGTPNLGLLDQVAALTWVRDNIVNFGGDPGQVTVMGESAGAMSIAALLTMPRAEGLFQRAIMGSGAGHHAISPASSRIVGKRLAKILGVEASREGLASVPVADLVAAQGKLSDQLLRSPFRRVWGDVASNLMPFEPVVDGDILPRLPIDAIRDGAGRDIDVLVGYNTQEFRLFFQDTPDRGPVTRTTTWILGRLYGLHGRDYSAYRRWGSSDWDAMIAMLTDAYYRIPALTLAAAHGRAHVYRFGWHSPAADGRMGAAHTTELPFVFDNLESPDWQNLLKGERPTALASAMHLAWVAFAKTGDPGWPSYGDQRLEREFGGLDRILSDHGSESRRLWSGRR